MRYIRHTILISCLLGIVLSASQCKKPAIKTDTNPELNVNFSPYFNSSEMALRTTEYTKADGEMLTVNSWSILLSKLSLIKTDDTKVLLGDGYVWVDFYSGHTRLNFKNLPEGDFKGISFQFGLDSLINHADPNVWASTHPLNPNLTGMHWGWAGGYIFQILDGTYKPSSGGSSTAFSYHTVGDAFTRNYTLLYNFSLSKNTSKTATIQIDLNEFFKTPTPISIAAESSNHSGTKTEISWMQSFVSNGEDAYKISEVK